VARNESRCEGSCVVLGGDVAIWSVKVGCVFGGLWNTYSDPRRVREFWLS
jgi:hypothetical protein